MEPEAKSFAKWFLDVFGVSFAYMVAAFFGGVAGVKLAERPGIWQGAAVITVGLGLGGYSAAAATAYWQMAPSTGALVAFIVGALAMPLLVLLFGIVKNFNASRIARRLESNIPGRDDIPKPPETP